MLGRRLTKGAQVLDHRGPLTLKRSLLLLQAAWLKILVSTLVVGSFTFVANYFFLPSVYESRTLIMAKTSKSGSSLDAMIGQLGAISGLGGMMGGLGDALSSEIQQFQVILKSTALQTRVVEDKKIAGRLLKMEQPSGVDTKIFTDWAVKEMRRNLSFKLDLNSLILSFRSNDRELSYLVIAGMLEALQRFLNENIVTQSRSAEIFVKERLRELNDQVNETELWVAKLKTGERRPDPQRSIQSEISRAERQYARLIQLVSLLSQQNELAQIESKRNDPMFLVVDPPQIALGASGPNRLDNTIVGFICGLLIGILGVLIADRIRAFEFL